MKMNETSSVDSLLTMSLVGDLLDGYRDLMINKRDPRVDDWLLMSSPWPTLAIVMSYVYFVKRLGPEFMKNRQPFNLRLAIIAYNLIQVAVSVYLVYQICAYAWIPRYSLRCQPVDYSDDPVEVWVAHLFWWYFICKFSELMDTIFFVLRKKFDQITNLHVIHHSVMPMIVWWGVKFTAGGHATFAGTLNTFVHVIMYSYYLLAALGPQFQKYLWWKKYLTTLQIVQFLVIFLHSIQIFYNGCDFPKAMAYCQCILVAVFMALFGNFYVQAYVKRRRLPNAGKVISTVPNGVENGKIQSGMEYGKLANGVKNSSISPLVYLAKGCWIGQNGLLANGISQDGKYHANKDDIYRNGTNLEHHGKERANGVKEIIHCNGKKKEL